MVVIVTTSVAYLGSGATGDVHHRAEPHVCPLALSSVLKGHNLNFRSSSKKTQVTQVTKTLNGTRHQTEAI